MQRLTAEPNNKQTFCPVQPHEFVQFEADDLILDKLKMACAAHFGLPVRTCDILVSNKGPSCTNINQILHRKDKVRNIQMTYDFTILCGVYTARIKYIAEWQFIVS